MSDMSGSVVGSVVGSETTKRDGSLLKRRFSSTEVNHLVRSIGIGYTPEQAEKKCKSQLENVIKFDIQDPRRIFVSSEMSDARVGRYLFEKVGSCLLQGGETLYAVVKENYNLESHLSDITSEMSDIDQEIQNLKNITLVENEPSKSIFDMELLVEIADQDEKLLSYYKDLMDQRIGSISDEVFEDSQE